MRSYSLFLVSAIVVAACVAAQAQAPSYNNVGRAPTEKEIKAWDLAIRAPSKFHKSNKRRESESAVAIFVRIW